MSDLEPVPELLLQAAMSLRELIQSDKDNPEYRFLQFCFANAPTSSAQLFQDLLALFITRKRQGGFSSNSAPPTAPI